MRTRIYIFIEYRASTFPHLPTGLCLHLPRMLFPTRANHKPVIPTMTGFLYEDLVRVGYGRRERHGLWIMQQKRIGFARLRFYLRRERRLLIPRA